MRSALAALALAAGMPAAAASAPPAEIEARYHLAHRTLGTIGHAQETFERSGDSYRIRSVTTSEGALKIFYDEQLVLESSGRVNTRGLQPLAFHQRRSSTGKGSIRATFDWKAGVMRATRGGNTAEIALPEGTQDRLSVMYQFMYAPLDGGMVRFHMTNGKKVERYTYRFVAEERITTPAGEFDTLHYSRVVADRHESRADVWLARDRFHLPVRVIFDDPDGLRLEQTLTALSTR